MADTASPGADGREGRVHERSHAHRPRTDLIGRVADLERLDAALREVISGRTVTVIVGGEAGVGKTRLVDAFTERARGAGCRVLAGNCLELGDRGIPYAPFVEAFRAVVRETDPGALPALLGPGRAELGRLLPEAGFGGAPHQALGDNQGGGQTRLFELFLGLLERLTNDRPLVLAIEDLQWADQSTRDLLSFLSHVMRRSPLMFVVTARSDELDVRHPVLAFLAEIERLPNVERLEVVPLDRAEVAALMRAVLGHEPAEEEVDAVAERTNGNPFFVEQLLASEIETRDDRVPPRLHDVLLGRIARLSPGAQELLRAASAAGARVDDELLAAVSDQPPRELRDLLREVLDHQVLVPVRGHGSGTRYEFRHALLKEIVYQQLFPGERRRLHAAYADALATRLATAGGAQVEPATPAELAYHWDAAGDHARALPAAIAAGDDAVRVYAHGDALRHYERALAAWDLVPDAEALVGADRALVLERAAEAASNAGAYHRAIELGRAALGALPVGSDMARVAWLHERLRWYLFATGDREAAEAELRLAERLVPLQPPTGARAVIVAHQAGIELFAGHYLRSRSLAEEALLIADACEAPAQRAISQVLGWDLAMLGDVGAGIALFREGLARAEEDGSAEGVALGYSSLAELWDMVGRPKEALEVARQGLDHAHRMGFLRTYGGLLLAAQAGAYLSLGRWDEAARSTAEGLERRPTGRSAVALNLEQARLDIGRGAFGEAAMRLRMAREIDDSMGGTGHRMGILAADAELACWQGRIEDCRRTVAAALVDPPDGPPAPAVCRLMVAGARAEADAAERSRARRDDAGAAAAITQMEELASRLAELSSRPALRAQVEPGIGHHGEAAMALVAAELTRAHGIPDAAAWDRAALAFEALEEPDPAAYAGYRRAVAVMASRGARSEAEDSLRQAHATARRSGAEPLRREIELLARQARLSLEPGGQVGDELEAQAAAGTDPLEGLGLTAREIEVLRLVAGGWTNQQIGDTLFITRKTASVHVSNILGKLGVDSRVEAAAVAHRLGGPGSDVPLPPDALGR